MADNRHTQYKVTSQRKGIEPDGQGGYHDVWTVGYETASGVRSHVKLPATHYTAQNVHELVQHESQHIEQVNSLGNGGPPPEPPL